MTFNNGEIKMAYPGVVLAPPKERPAGDPNASDGVAAGAAADEAVGVPNPKAGGAAAVAEEAVGVPNPKPEGVAEAAAGVVVGAPKDGVGAVVGAT